MAYYEKMKNGTWSVRYRETVDGVTVNRRLRGFATKREAEVEYHKIAVTIETKPSQRKAKNQLSLHELFLNYVAFAQTQVKESTLYDMQTLWQRHIDPFFAQFQTVSKIKKIDILKWQTTLNEQGYSFRYKSKLRTFLSTVWKFGQRYYDIENDPITGVEPFRRTEPKQEMQVWNEQEFAEFINAVDDDVYVSLFSFLYSTGCRKGESLALRWKNIDTNKKTARIEKSITRRFDKAKHPNATWLETSPKNIYSVRTIDLSQKLVDLLVARQWLENAKPNDFVFGGDAPLPATTIQRNFDKAVEKSGVKKIRIHDLRHSHASFLISKGLDVVAVAKRLGHANTQETLNTYAHFFQKDRDKVRAVLDSL
jgi:integrase